MKKQKIVWARVATPVAGPKESPVKIGPTTLSTDAIARQVQALERISTFLAGIGGELTNLNGMLNQRMNAIAFNLSHLAGTAEPISSVTGVASPVPQKVTVTTAAAAKAAGMRIFKVAGLPAAPVKKGLTVVRASMKPATKAKAARR